jgi:hypothetical protein
MTTGRINQVTVVTPSDPHAVARREKPPRGAAEPCYKEGARRKARPAGGVPGAEREGPPMAIHLPPLSSPRGGPPRGSSGSRAARHRCMCPSGGGSPSPSHARGRLLVRVCPRRSGGTVAIGQPSTDPKMCPPVRGLTGLLLPLRARRQAARNDLARRRCADQS